MAHTLERVYDLKLTERRVRLVSVPEVDPITHTPLERTST